MSGHKMAAGSLSGWHYGIVKDIVSGEKTEYEVHNNCKPSRVYGIEGSRIVWLELKAKSQPDITGNGSLIRGTKAARGQ